MKRILLISTPLTLIIGIVFGTGITAYINHKRQVSELNFSLSVLSSELAKAKYFDMKFSTLKPTTALEKGYQVNLKVDVGQMSSLWTAISPELIKEGFSTKDIQDIGWGLTVVYNNILPPYGAASEDLSSVEQAREWISMFADSLVPKTPVRATFNYVTQLRSKISSIAAKYQSYKKNTDFEVTNF